MKPNYIVVLFALLCAVTAVAEEPSMVLSRHAVYGSVGSIGLGLSTDLSYEASLLPVSSAMRMDLRLRAGAGAAAYGFGFGGFGGGLSLVVLTGRRARHHLEVGGGAAGGYGGSSVEVAPVLYAGYRRQDPGSRSRVFRVGGGSPWGVYVSYGFAF